MVAVVAENQCLQLLQNIIIFKYIKYIGICIRRGTRFFQNRNRFKATTQALQQLTHTHTHTYVHKSLYFSWGKKERINRENLDRLLSLSSSLSSLLVVCFSIFHRCYEWKKFMLMMMCFTHFTTYYIKTNLQTAHNTHTYITFSPGVSERKTEKRVNNRRKKNYYSLTSYNSISLLLRQQR